MVAANELFLQELVEDLQKYLIEEKLEWIEQNFELTHQTSFQSNSFWNLNNFNVRSQERLFTVNHWILFCLYRKR